MFVVLIGAPFLINPVFAMNVLCFGIFACAFNLLLGYGGLLSFGHASFFGSAAYMCAYAAKVWHWPPELALLSGTAFATALGLCFGALAIRRQGIYFAMITLALAQMVYFICVQASFTGGEDGIQAVPRGYLFGFIDLANDRSLYYFVAAIFCVSMVTIHRIINSPFGQIVKAIRDNELRAVSLGYRTSHYKLIIFTLSAGLAGLAGATKVLVLQLASLTDVHWAMSGEVILMTLLGGLGAPFAPNLGALLILTIQNYMSGLGGWVTFIQGIVFIFCVVALRKGIVGLLTQMFRRVKNK